MTVTAVKTTSGVATSWSFDAVDAWGQTVKIAPPLTIPLDALQEGLVALGEATDEAVTAH